jgi:flagellar FliL protein
MSDDHELDLGDEDAGGDAGGAAPKKKGGLGNLLPTILKFAAIGIGALIFIVTVSVITYSVMNRGGKSQTVVSDPLSPYLGTRQEFAMYTGLGPITTRTRDYPGNASVTVEMIIAYDLNNPAAATELSTRQYELHDFVRRYFAGKYVADLTPEKEETLKKEIQEQLNTRFLDTARARLILFKRLDAMEMF